MGCGFASLDKVLGTSDEKSRIVHRTGTTSTSASVGSLRAFCPLARTVDVGGLMRLATIVRWDLLFIRPELLLIGSITGGNNLIALDRCLAVV
jgi:hypothetical protein